MRAVFSGWEEDIEHKVDIGILRGKIEEVLEELSPRERAILKLRFGLDDGCDRTYEQVAYEFNVTRERIRQIEAKALRKLRHPDRSRKLEAYLV